ncbi:MAG: hypothetical protein ACI8RD_007165, partial [Bacillariaceae sp.]
MRFLTLVDRCRRHNQCVVVSSIRCSWLVTDDGNHVRYLTTLMNPTMIGQHRSYYSASLSQELLQPRRLQFLCRSLSTNTHDDNETTNEE